MSQIVLIASVMCRERLSIHVAFANFNSRVSNETQLKQSMVYGVVTLSKVVDHYENPRNVGSLDKNSKNVGTGLVGAPACGDVMKLQVWSPRAFYFVTTFKRMVRAPGRLLFSDRGGYRWQDSGCTIQDIWLRIRHRL